MIAAHWGLSQSLRSRSVPSEWVFSPGAARVGTHRHNVPQRTRQFRTATSSWSSAGEDDQCGLKEHVSFATADYVAAASADVWAVGRAHALGSFAANRGVIAVEWRPIRFDDIPSRAEFERLTFNLLQQGITNSDRMRDGVRRCRHLILQKSTGNWNATPSGPVRE